MSSHLHSPGGVPAAAAPLHFVDPSHFKANTREAVGDAHLRSSFRSAMDFLQAKRAAHFGEPHMIAPSKQRFDHILAHPTTARFDWGTPHSTDHWSWCDALFMAPVAWLQLWKTTGDRRYLALARRFSHRALLDLVPVLLVER